MLKNETLLIIGLIALVLIGQTLSYEDEVEQHARNCSSATYIVDNNLNCEGE